jgi:hypothetical protein
MKIEIEFNSVRYHIDPTPECFILVKHDIIKTGDNSGNVRENTLGYFTKLSNAVNAIVRENLSDSQDKVTLLEYVERYENALKELRDIIDLA